MIKKKSIEYRVEQLEIALMNLMFVVANQEDELPLFKDNMKKAKEMATNSEDVISLISDTKAEA